MGREDVRHWFLPARLEEDASLHAQSSSLPTALQIIRQNKPHKKRETAGGKLTLLGPNVYQVFFFRSNAVVSGVLPNLDFFNFCSHRS